MAGMRIAIAIVGFCVSGFCFLEFAMGVVLTYTAYRRGPLRGVSFHSFARVDAMFIIAALVSLWIAVKILPTQVA
jgi:hypothetical protein